MTLTREPQFAAPPEDGAAIFWAGRFPPNLAFSSSASIYSPQRDFRVEPHLHGTFDQVFLVEEDLGSLKQWPLVLDEAIRLLRRSGSSTLTVRMKERSIVDHHTIATFLRLRHDATFSPTEVEQTSDGHLTLTMRCERDCRASRLSSFEFAVITNGDRPQRLAEFVASVNEIIGIEHVDAGIAICGPSTVADELPESRIPVRIIDPPTEFGDKAWITGKKNRIVETSPFENLLIVHDRFAVSKEFLIDLYAFGADFDILNPAQVDSDGERVGDWVMAGSHTPLMDIALLDYNDYGPGVFVNGGAIIAKRDALLAVPWSELLFWGQAEDVELSRAFTAQGYTARLGRSITLLVTDSRAGFREFFTPLPMLRHRFVELAEPESTTNTISGAARYGRSIALAGSSATDLAYQGVSIPEDQWISDAKGLLPRSPHSELSIDFARPVHEALRVTVTLCSGTPPDVSISSRGTQQATSVQPLGSGFWLAECAISLEDVTFAANGPFSHARSLRLGITSSAPCHISAIRINRQDPIAAFPVRIADFSEQDRRMFGPGWGAVEPWGIWSTGNTALLKLPVPPQLSGRDFPIVVSLSAHRRYDGQDLFVGVRCEGVATAALSIPGSGQTVRRSIVIPSHLTEDSREFELEFQIVNPISPQSLGISSDNRDLGIGLREIRLGRARPHRRRR